MKKVFLYNLNSHYARLRPNLAAKPLTDSIHLSIHMKYMAFLLKDSQWPAGFPGKETVIQAGPGKKQTCANSHMPCAERSPLGHAHGGVCASLLAGSPGCCINCLEHESYLWQTQPDFGSALVLIS